MRKFLLGSGVLALCAGLLVDPADARRRRPRGVVTGKLSPKFRNVRRGPEMRAYWVFGVPNLQRRWPRARFAEFVVALDVWDEAGLRSRGDPEMVTEGVALTPPVLVVPRRSDRVRVVFRNVDTLKYRLLSRDHPALNNLVLVPNAREVVTLEGILPLQPGRFARYRLRDHERPTVRGEILVIRSTAWAHPDARGRFRIRGVPKGEHVLRVIHEGKVVAEKKVRVGRRPLKLKVLSPR